MGRIDDIQLVRSIQLGLIVWHAAFERYIPTVGQRIETTRTLFTNCNLIKACKINPNRKQPILKTNYTSLQNILCT